MAKAPDHRRLIFSLVAVACFAASGVWYLAAKAESDWRQKMDGLRNDVTASGDLRNISRQMQGLPPLPVDRVNTDPGIPVLPITIIFLIGVTSAGAAIAIRPAVE